MDDGQSTRAALLRRQRPLDERLRSLLVRGYGLPAGDFTLPLVERVMRVLNAARPEHPPMRAHVLWMSAPTAFTFPGQHVYLSRTFVERSAGDAL